MFNEIVHSCRRQTSSLLAKVMFPVTANWTQRDRLLDRIGDTTERGVFRTLEMTNHPCVWRSGSWSQRDSQLDINEYRTSKICSLCQSIFTRYRNGRCNLTPGFSTQAAKGMSGGVQDSWTETEMLQPTSYGHEPRKGGFLIHSLIVSATHVHFEYRQY